VKVCKGRPGKCFDYKSLRGMIQPFDNLDDREIELMFKAPILVCILIAGADGTIDKSEINEAIIMARKETKSKSSVTQYYQELSQDFEDKLKVLIQSYPFQASQRTQMILEELTALNAILPKLDRVFAQQFYGSLKKIAERIASSSGGLLGMNSVGSEEAKYIQLSMIRNPGS